MLGRLSNLCLEAVTATVSAQRVPVASRMERLLSEKKAKRLIRTTGIEALSIAEEGVCTSDLAFESAVRVFSRIQRMDIGAIIFLSQTPDYLSPATSYCMQARLELPSDILAYDVNLGCSGFPYGLFLAGTLLPMLGGRKVLLVGGDTVSRNSSPEDSAMYPIIADAGFAAVVGRGNGSMAFHMESYGERADALLLPRGGARVPRLADRSGLTLDRDNYTVMDGMAVTDFTFREVPDNISRLLTFAEENVGMLDGVIFHQANAMIVKTLAEKLDIPPERAPFMSRQIGNTSSASIPVCLAELKREGRSCEGHYLFSGFGVGLSIASILLDLQADCVLETGEL